MRRILLAMAALFGAAVVASAATVPYRTDAELIAIADRVVRGRVLDSAAERAPSGVIRTRTRVAVIEDFTGGAETILIVHERGGRLPDGTTLWIPGAPQFAPGDDVVLCLERTVDGYRTVSMAFSAFRVGAAVAGDRPLTRFDGVAVVGGRGVAGVEASRGLAAFRRTAQTVRRVAARALLSEGQAAAAVAAVTPGDRVDAPFTLLGDGLRWQQADSGQSIAWYRNTLRPSTVQGADTDDQIRAALVAWTAPPTASIALAFGGTRNVAIQDISGEDPYCTDGNLGVGLITFGDPLDELPVGVLAIGGGCATAATHVVNGQIFNAFTHGLVVLNDDAAMEGYRTVPNITRILEHEVGHAIGLGHTDAGQDNIMYPSCCAAAMPVPPAIGPDDLAGLVFIYPPPVQPCGFTVTASPSTVGPVGGTISVAVVPSRAGCPWTASTTVPWLVIVEGESSGSTGSAGTLRVVVAARFGAPAPRTGAVAVGPASATITQGGDTDNDADGLPDAWETFFGLDPTSAVGDSAPGADPDGDGVSNAAEYAGGSHPRGTFRRYFAEGAANAFFATQIALFNPVQGNAAVLVRIQPQSGVESAWPIQLDGLRRRMMPSPLLRTLAGGAFSTLIESDRPIVADRTMTWDATGYGAHAESAIEAPSTTWYLAEGSTSGGFELFYLLQNPGDVAAQATVRFLRPAPQPPVTRSYTIGPRSRLTIPVDSLGPDLVSTDVSGVVEATQPIIVERAMYLNRPGQPFAAGHESAGVTAPALEWFLAEGATGGFFDLFILIENPGLQPALTQVDFLLQGGGTISKQYTVAPESRFTIYVDDEQFPAGSGQRLLANTSVAARIRSLNATPIIVERAMWWPQPNWYEAHNAPATTRTGFEWAMADGYAGGPNDAETYVLIANTSTRTGSALIRLSFDDGLEGDSGTITLPPQSRVSVPIGSTFTGSRGRRFGIYVLSTGSDPVPIVVERATYESPGGVLWAAGTDAVATRLTP